MSFKDTYPLEKRIAMYTYVHNKYPDRIPCIISSKDVTIEKFKFLLKSEDTVSLILIKLREEFALKPEEGVFLHVNNITMGGSHLISQYEKYKDPEDGFLYITLTKENTFGGF